LLWPEKFNIPKLLKFALLECNLGIYEYLKELYSNNYCNP